MMCDKLGYQVVNNTTTTIKPTPAGFFGLSVTGAGNVTVYDNAAAGSGVVLYTKTGFTTITFNDVGDSVTLQYFTTLGWMILSNNGCTVA